VTYLLDTNVLSEWWKPTPNPAVVSWLETAEWFLPAPVIAEIQEGAGSRPQPDASRPDQRQAGSTAH
jgi:predicted nucleic acid-binding protein